MAKRDKLGRNNPGRPKLDIDEDKVLKLASIGCTNVEISHVMNCSVDTIGKRFSDTLAKGRSNMKMRLRGHMFKAVENGNVTMMIWLSKNILGYSDKIEEKQTIEVSNKEVDDKRKQEIIEHDPVVKLIESKVIDAEPNEE